MAEAELKLYLTAVIARKKRQIQELEEEIKKLQTKLFDLERKSPK